MLCAPQTRSALASTRVKAPRPCAARTPETTRARAAGRSATVASTSVDKSKVNKVVLAYSGGLDTSVILKWLQEEYDCEVVTFTADLGQGEELEPARKKAEAAGVKEIFVDDLREEFVRCVLVIWSSLSLMHWMEGGDSQSPVYPIRSVQSKLHVVSRLPSMTLDVQGLRLADVSCQCDV